MGHLDIRTEARSIARTLSTVGPRVEGLLAAGADPATVLADLLGDVKSAADDLELVTRESETASCYW